MKFLFDLLPVIFFLLAFKWGEGHASNAQSFLHDYLGSLISAGSAIDQAPIMLATLVAIVATTAQIVYLLARRKKIDGMLWFSFGIIVVFGGLTIYFHNDTFIKWKLSILYWGYALTLLISRTLLGKNLTRSFLGMLEQEMQIPAPMWERLNIIWIAFFAAMGGLNLLVAYNFSTATWVNFKAFGSTGLMFVFILLQIVYLSRFTKPSDEST